MAEALAAERVQASEPSRWQVGTGWVIVFATAFALYAATAQRGAQWQDSGEKMVRVLRGEVVNPLGLALSHALHYWLGRAAVRVTDLEPVFAVTLVSALAGGLAVANVFGCVMTLTGRKWAALFAAASLMLANTFWQLSTVLESYTLSAALLAAECWCLTLFAKRCGEGVLPASALECGGCDGTLTLESKCSTAARWPLWGMLFFNGLGVANHLQAGLTTPVLAVLVVWALCTRRVKVKDVLIGAGLWVVGSLPYSGLVVAELVRSGDFTGTLRSALVGKYGGNVMNSRFSMRMVAVTVGFPLLSFPNLLLPAAGYGIARARRIGVPAVAWRALLAGLIIHAVFVARYNIKDQQTFFLPTYVLLCIFGGIGAAAVLEWPRQARRRIAAAAVVLLALTPLVYWGAATAGRQFDLLRGVVHHKPYRDDYTYLFIPWSVADRSAQRMSRRAVELSRADGLVLVEDSMAIFAVEYQAMRLPEKRPEIVSWPGAQEATVLNDDAKRAVAAGRPVVLVPLDADRAPPVGRWVRHGDLYVLDADSISAGLGTKPG